MQVEARHLTEVRFEVLARGHRVICDQPRDNGGSDAGMSPPEFLLASLATCAGYYAVQYLKTRGIPSDGLTVHVAAEKAVSESEIRTPARLASFRIEVTVPDLDERHQAGVLRSVRSCLIHNTLLNTPHIEIAVNAPVLGRV